MNAIPDPKPQRLPAAKGCDYERIAAAIRFIAAHAEAQPRLADVAAHLGLSEFHCQRLFHRWAGVTPKDFLQVITLERAKTSLAARRPLLATALDSGLSSTSRLHDLFLTLESMTPGEFARGGAGLTIRWGWHPTPLGDALIAVTDRGLCGLRFGSTPEDRAGLLAETRAQWPAAEWKADAAATRALAAEVTKRMRGGTGQSLALLLRGTPFQIKVWQALLAIPAGEVTTYGALAEAVGQPTASRAVGSAVGANPVGWLIPCHRVLRGTGLLGGYRWGTDRKRAALVLDAALDKNSREPREKGAQRQR